MKSKSESKKGKRLMLGASTSGLAVRGAAGTPRKRLEGAFGARFRFRSLAGAGTREVKRLSDFCTLTPFPAFMSTAV
jgi:hypothetical protein